MPRQFADFGHFWGQDIQQSATGGIALVTGSDRTSQRILRRLLTVGGTYLWQLEYGAGLPAKIGRTLDIPHLRALIIGQIALEPSVARTPAPTVDIRADTTSGTVFISILYSDNSGKTTPLNFYLVQTPQLSGTPIPPPILEAITPPSPQQLPPAEADRIIYGTAQNPAILETESATPIVTETGQDFLVS